MANLNSTSLLFGVDSATEGVVRLSSVANIAKGDVIAPVSPDGLAHEAMVVLETPNSALKGVRVARGQCGTRAARHQIGLTVYTGPSNLFYTLDPTGIPFDYPPANPLINLANGRVWFAEGPQVGNVNARFWQLLTPQPVLNNVGALGIQIPVPAAPTS